MTIQSRQQASGQVRLKLARPTQWTDLARGESIAVDGTCLTLEAFTDRDMEFYLNPETIQVTTLGNKSESSVVNLERSLRFGDRLGGHWVSGHIDGTATVSRLTAAGESKILGFTVSKKLLTYMIEKGSVAVNGVSLTINDVDLSQRTFSVCLIPETLKLTNLNDLKVGDSVNIECDQMVKMVDAIVKQRQEMEVL